jgi:hypothetical protein
LRGPSNSARGDKGSAARVQARQRLVLRYYLIGTGPDEIAARPGINASRATVYRDLEALRADISKKIEACKLWPIKRHVLLQEELMHQAWQIFYRPKEKRVVGKGKSAHEIELDDSFRRLFTIDRIHKISEHLAKLAYPSAEKGEEERDSSDPVRVALKLIEGLPLAQKDKIVTKLRSELIQEAPVSMA